MTKINLLNEKGNVRPKVREGIQEQLGSIMCSTLPMALEKVKANTYVVEIGEVESTGEPIFAEVTIGVSTTHPSDRKQNRKSVSKKEVEVPELF